MAMWNSASLARDGTDVAIKARDPDPGDLRISRIREINGRSRRIHEQNAYLARIWPKRAVSQGSQKAVLIAGFQASKVPKSGSKRLLQMGAI